MIKRNATRLRKMVVVIIITSICMLCFSTNTFAEEVNKSGPVLEFNKLYKENNITANTNKWYTVRTLENSACYNLHIKNIDSYNGVYESLRIFVYDSDGMCIREWAQNNETEEDNWVKLEKNSVYYIRILTQLWREDGTATFSSSIDPDDDAPDTINEAGVIPYGKEIYEYIRINDDNDFYKFKTNKGAYVYNIYVKDIDVYNGVYDSLYLTLYDDDGTEVYSKNIHMGNEISEKIILKPGKTYFCKFVGNLYHKRQTGKYKFRIDAIKETGNTKKTAETIKAKKTYKKAIDAPSDIDWFLFKPTKTKSYKIKIKNKDNAQNTVVKVYNGKKLVKSIDVSKGSSGTIKVKMKKKKKYYITISSMYDGFGKYNVSVK